MKAVHASLAALGCVAMLVASSSAQNSEDAPQLKPRNGVVTAEAKTDAPPAPAVVVPTGTKIPLTLKQGVNSKSARPGDPVYAQTAFPITQDNHIVIPAGTFVQGEVQRVVR